MYKRQIYTRSLQDNEIQIEKLKNLEVKRYSHNNLQSWVKQKFSAENIETFDFDNVLCNKKTCMIGTEEKSYYFDDDHLSVSGSTLLNQSIQKILASIPIPEKLSYGN